MQSVVGWGHDPWLVCRKYVWHSGQNDSAVEHRELKIVISFLSHCLDRHIFSVELVFINNALLHTNSIHHLNLFPFTSSPHMCSSLCGYFCSLSLSPSRVHSVKENKRREKKGSAERLKLYFVYLEAVCLLSRYVAILSPRDRINLCSERKVQNCWSWQSYKALGRKVELGPVKALPAGKVSQRSRLA